MITRLVKMEFSPENIESFKELFKNTRDKIAASEGCRELHLLHDIHNPNTFITYSIWESEVHLLQYRDSALFNSTWEIVKPWFNNKPEAWSLDKI